MRFIIGLILGVGLGAVVGYLFNDLLQDEAMRFQQANDVILEQARQREREALGRQGEPGSAETAAPSQAPPEPEAPAAP